MESIGKIAIYALSTLVWGFTLKLCWTWFLVPLHVPELQGYAHVFGVALTIGYLTKNTNVKDEREEAEKLATVILYPLLALLFGYIYHSLM